MLQRHITSGLTAGAVKDELREAETSVLIDLAHALMLTRQHVFGRDQGRAIVDALLALLAGDTAQPLGNDPRIGTITLHIECYLEQQCGPAGVDIQRARSRIDQNATGLLMADRAGTWRCSANWCGSRRRFSRWPTSTTVDEPAGRTRLRGEPNERRLHLL